MPKSPPSSQHSNNLSPSQLSRRSIHDRLKINEDEISEDESIEDSPQYKKLYPDLSYELKAEKASRQSESPIRSKGEWKQHSNEENKTAYEGTTLTCKTYFILIAVVILFFVYIFFPNSGGVNKTAELNIVELVEGMQNRFKEQEFQTFKLLKLALNRVVNVKHEPAAPAIITLIANKGTENTASDFTEYLANALTSGKYVSINESAYWLNDPDGLKYKIDQEIKSKVEKSTLNVIIVDKLHNIPIEAAMIFHGYCDHESAPYKRVVFLFIVHMNEIIPKNASSKDLDAAAMKYLRNIWQSSTDDVVDSLITRITVTVINIR